jgi:8-oxo-dGTP pyrophosphatase MutT (NUDIX family)
MVAGRIRREAPAREAREELGITLQPESLHLVRILCAKPRARCGIFTART